ncbi:hypothetical protein C8R43DRAFT_960381 [Mycena crocata]|nr:hypothetical protein C8R43DRAFT_960381 [Mycena crocata]
MAAELVLPQLREWAQGHSISLLEAKTVPLFDTAFEHFFARELNVTINGERITRNTYRGNLISYANFPDHFEETRTVQFTQILDVPFYDPEFTKAGVVGLTYNATYGSSFILGSLHLMCAAELRALTDTLFPI